MISHYQGSGCGNCQEFIEGHAVDETIRGIELCVWHYWCRLCGISTGNCGGVAVVVLAYLSWGRCGDHV